MNQQNISTIINHTNGFRDEIIKDVVALEKLLTEEITKKERESARECLLSELKSLEHLTLDISNAAEIVRTSRLIEHIQGLPRVPTLQEAGTISYEYQIERETVLSIIIAVRYARFVNRIQELEREAITHLAGMPA